MELAEAVVLVVVVLVLVVEVLVVVRLQIQVLQEVQQLIMVVLREQVEVE